MSTSADDYLVQYLVRRPDIIKRALSLSRDHVQRRADGGQIGVSNAGPAPMMGNGTTAGTMLGLSGNGGKEAFPAMTWGQSMAENPPVSTGDVAQVGIGQQPISTWSPTPTSGEQAVGPQLAPQYMPAPQPLQSPGIPMPSTLGGIPFGGPQFTPPQTGTPWDHPISTWSPFSGQPNGQPQGNPAGTSLGNFGLDMLHNQ